MADKIRLGIVGANVENGSWGARTHVPALSALPEYELKAVCTAHQETADAAAKAFGAELAFGDIDVMLKRPDIDMVAVCVRVPYHHELTMKALEAGKSVYTEWPLGANTREAEEMAAKARAKNVRTMIGLQARADPYVNYARALVADGYIGEVLSATMTQFGSGILERPMDRTWQGDPKLGGNTLTISAGHSIDAMNYILGEFSEVSARLVTRVKQWKASDTGAMVDVQSADNIIVNGVLASGAVVGIHVAAIPYNGTGWRLEVYGREGTLVATGGSANLGASRLMGSKGNAPLAELQVPDKFRYAPEGTPKGAPYNVAQMYLRFADGAADSETDFELAVKRHKMIDAIQRSSDEGRPVKL